MLQTYVFYSGFYNLVVLLYRFLFIQGPIIPARTIISITLVLVKTTIKALTDTKYLNYNFFSCTMLI